MQNKKNSIYIVAVVALLLLLVIGYAVLQTNLNINGTTIVNKNTWSIHFANLTLNPNNNVESVEQEATINDAENGVDFEITLSLPKQYYSFNVDVINDGTIDAKLDTIIKTTLSETESKYLNYYVTYADGGEIKKNDLLPVDATENLRVLVEFKNDPVALPESEKSITLSATLNYVQDDGDGVNRSTNILYNVLKDNAVMDNIASPSVTSSTGINFGTISSNTNGNGVYTLSKTSTEANPIYYYRGNVDNNVIFANFCWKMIRTTETGGVKLIYNGTPVSGVCTNTGNDTTIGNSAYNTNDNDIKYAGYTYDDGTGTQIDSIIKNTIDTWYQTNLNTYSTYLEDIAYYNERDNVAGDGFEYAFPSRIRIWGTKETDYENIVPNTSIKLGASNLEDKYTTTNTNGNNLLKYKIGLITSDEVVLAGGRGYISDENPGTNTNYYLNNNTMTWTISPNRLSKSKVYINNIDIDGRLTSTLTSSSGGIRPVVSLSRGTTYQEGNGSSSTPYIIA